jgi:STE24 endopeptidase
VLGGFFSLFFGSAIAHYLALTQLKFHDSDISFIYPFIEFLLSATFIICYLRFVLGFFSRLFERQADLHVFDLDISPQHMIDVLDRVGVLSGNIHKEPNWHHYSIDERMTYLKEAQVDPKLIQKHHFRVKKWTYSYITLLICGAALLASPAFKGRPVIGDIGKGLIESANVFSYQMNQSVRYSLAKEYLFRYKLKGNSALITELLQHSFTQYAADSVRGVAEFYSSQLLLEKEELLASAALMTKAWQRFDFSDTEESVREDFIEVSYRILAQMQEKELLDTHEARQLMDEMRDRASP